ncbi:hypothetical protein COCVIDRAFT_103946 [Bipolaris victoriae FI3]|uniref:Uncharacterized protein n=1 Tax=Bipolaris victoriae (strain FI3) TaxID=930091 RepID=W7EHL1_BIPV3|nr:hypothetical protein COCVIDRAFT_103946 [Bipolaris victoriae FI3]
MAPPNRDGRPASRDGESSRNPTSKRVKRTESDDAATTRPESHEKNPEDSTPAIATPARRITSQTALPRLAARLMTPTRSSAARSQSVKTLKTTSMISTFGKPPSTVKIAKSASTDQASSPSSKLSQIRAVRDGAREGLRKACSHAEYHQNLTDIV